MSRCLKWSLPALTLICALFTMCAVSAARADHVTINCGSADLTDLTAAIQANLGESNGGFLEDSTNDNNMHSRNIFTGSCQYVNGFDMVRGLMLLDFKNPDGTRSSTTDLYAGWQVTGVIGDVDGDGNPNTRTSSNPLCGGAILQDTPGIGLDEFYNLRLEFCSGTLLLFSITNGNVVVTRNGSPVVPAPGSVSFVFAGSTLKVCVHNLEALAPGEDINGVKIAMTSNASYDFLGEDGTLQRQIQLDNLIDVSKIPSSPTVCPSGTVNYTITVRNPGLATLNTITVHDVLLNGLTYLSDDKGSTGSATVRDWSFPSANLAPGGLLVIHLNATAPAECNGPLGDSVYVTGDNTCGTAAPAQADTFATVLCGAPSVAIRDTSTCQGIGTTLCAIQTGGSSAIAHYAWSGPGGPFPDAACITIPASAVGSAGPVAYSVLVTDGNGCTASDNGAVTVLPNPTVAIRDTSTCQGVGTTLCAIQTGGTAAIAHYTWSGPGGPYPDAPCITIPASAVGSPGSVSYSVSVTDANGCAGSDNGSVTVNPGPGVAIRDTSTCAGIGTTLCAVQTSGAAIAHYTWSGPGGPFPDAPCITIPASAVGSAGSVGYSVSVSDVNGCLGSDEGSVTVLPNPTVAIRDTSTCQGIGTTLCAVQTGGNAIAHYTWSGPGGPFPDAACITIPASAVGSVGSVSYSVSVTDVNGCIGSDNGSVTVTPNPTVAIRDTATCQGVATTLCAVQTGGGAIAHYTWSGPGGPFPDAACIDIPASAVGSVGTVSYSVSVSDASGCTGGDEGSVTVTPRPPCLISPVDTTIAAGGTATLCGPSGDFTYNWSTGASSRCINVTTETCVTLRVESSPGCFDTCHACVHVSNPPAGHCWLTGGGQSFDSDGHLHSYGGVINPGCSPTAGGGGNWNDLDHTSGVHFKGTDIVVDSCGNVPGIPPGSNSPKTPFNFIDFHGTGYVTGLNGGPNKRTDVFFNGHYEDRHEPGSLGQSEEARRDRYFLRVYTNQGNPVGSTVMLVDVDGNPATQDPVTIFHGNLQLHISGCSKYYPGLLPGEPEAEDMIELPTDVSFGLARPNPTGTSSLVRYSLPKAAQVSAKVFDVAGRVVRDLGSAAMAAGWHDLNWDLRGDAGQNVGPGLYFIRISVDGQMQTRHVTVMR